MIKKVSLILCTVIFIISLSFDVSAISAQSAVVLDVSSNQILYELNSDSKMSMASTTKLMTALIAAEYIENNSNETVLVTQEMVNVEGSSMGLLAGDKVTLYDLIIGMLLPSGNDAANAVALHVADSFEDFAVIMNERAKEIGMINSNFVTPSGLDADEHYSTALDMAKLMSVCMQNELVLEIMSSQSLCTDYYSSQKNRVIKVSFVNHNKLFSYYEYCVGGKTGYTTKSGRCLVTCAKKNSCDLVCVTFNAKDDWNDHIELYESAYKGIKCIDFDEVKFAVPYVCGGVLKVNIKSQEIYSLSDKEITRKIFLPKFIYENSYEAGDIIGYERYYEEDVLILENEINY